MTLYQYEPLKSVRDIRLFKLRGSEDAYAKIEGEILHVAPGDGVIYEALSYYWGTRSSVEPTVSIAGLSIPITDNLHSALLQLRNNGYAQMAGPPPYSPDRLLWIDALCINQQDLSERAQQVRHMRQIYQNAARVLVWLGESNEQTLKGIRFLQEIGSGFSTFYTAQLKHSLSEHATDIWRSAWAEYINEDRLDFINKFRYKDLLAVTHLLERAWFGRAWIIQEFSVNSNVTLVCGDVEVPNCDLKRGFYAFTKTPLHHQVVQKPSDVHNFRHLETLVSTTDTDEQGPQELQLLKYLISSREFGAQDPRDKVFALTGMALDGTRTPFEPNYDEDHGVELLYHRVAVHYITAGALSDVLMEAGLNYSTDIDERTNLDTRIPSWVPDWRQYLSARRMSNNAAARQVPPAFSLSDNGMILKVQCRVLDKVQIAASSRCFRDGYDIVYTALSDVLSSTKQSTPPQLTEAKVSLFLSDLRRTFCNRLKTYVLTRYASRTGYCNGQDAATALRRALYCNGVGPFTSSAHITDEARTRYDAAVADWLESGGMMPYNSSVAPSMPPYRRDFLMTKCGYLGWGPMDIQKGDVIVIIHGMPSPSVLRVVDQRHFRLLGDSYIHGFMDGEVLKDAVFPPTDVYLV
ncbi:hypothetical protein LTR37_009979 [Vermiconidia calcicola]|uniref:Uncharacterized protein n=1 Tax=Vermiconidia calcicola TaxID=1690605 RepID=A0ACC3N672_9PEZI|nr:hypothetical protein LTR37_009979 [Vermiconidia calcicola]